jgi:hypothetical protein
MALLYTKSNSFERHLSRSYLIEHGVAAVPLIKEINHNNHGAEKEKKPLPPLTKPAEKP